MVQAWFERRSMWQLSGSTALLFDANLDSQKVHFHLRICSLSCQLSSWPTAVRGPDFPDHDLCSLLALQLWTANIRLDTPNKVAAGNTNQIQVVISSFPVLPVPQPFMARPHQHSTYPVERGPEPRSGLSRSFQSTAPGSSPKGH